MYIYIYIYIIYLYICIYKYIYNIHTYICICNEKKTRLLFICCKHFAVLSIGSINILTKLLEKTIKYLQQINNCIFFVIYFDRTHYYTLLLNIIYTYKYIVQLYGKNYYVERTTWKSFFKNHHSPLPCSKYIST